ncbi:MAG: hypothetical protein J0I20_35655 [Chloroflexi bacterium]|mgnify:CR=1 FL=1|nr:hypothetical protein [Chloroflexota bacterium]OJV86941.1 MAG: hypothetical protein BGO39_28475 [Chloroflexi bacterium 54-19]
MDNFWTNVFGQIHAIWQGIGIFVLGTIASYVLATDPDAWNWRGVLVSAITGAATYILTRVDHKQVDKAVNKAAVTGEVPGKEAS